MSEIKTLPLPTRLAASGLKSEIVNFAERLVEHNVAAKDAEIEALRAEVKSLQTLRDVVIENHVYWKSRAERLAEALRELVALGHPRDPAIIAAHTALRDHDQDGKDG